MVRHRSVQASRISAKLSSLNEPLELPLERRQVRCLRPVPRPRQLDQRCGRNRMPAAGDRMKMHQPGHADAVDAIDEQIVADRAADRPGCRCPCLPAPCPSDPRSAALRDAISTAYRSRPAFPTVSRPASNAAGTGISDRRDRRSRQYCCRARAWRLLISRPYCSSYSGRNSKPIPVVVERGANRDFGFSGFELFGNFVRRSARDADFDFRETPG